MNNQKTFLIELSNGHAECMETTILSLKEQKKDFELIASRSILKSLGIEDEDYSNDFFNGNLSDYSKLKKYFVLLKLAKYINSFKNSNVFINTISGKDVLCFIKKVHKSIAINGILHDVKKYHSSRTQKSISKIVKNYFLLSDYLLEGIADSERNKFQVYYTDQYFRRDLSQSLEWMKGRIVFTIPGQIENKRRDYDSLIEVVSSLAKNKQLSAKPLFVLLGNGWHSHGDGESVKKRIENNGLQDYFKYYQSRVAESEFHSVISKSHYLLPLINPQNPDHKNYFINQISGTFNLARFYKLPMILDDNFKKHKEFSGSLFYSNQNFKEIIAQAIDKSSKLK